jgi:hypothetical protein
MPYFATEDELEEDVGAEYAEATDFADDEYIEDGDFADIDFESLGINPHGPTTAKPGSPEKVMMLAARYAAGQPLWHNEDCYDHGPGERALRLQQMQPAVQAN